MAQRCHADFCHWTPFGGLISDLTGVLHDQGGWVISFLRWLGVRSHSIELRFDNELGDEYMRVIPSISGDMSDMRSSEISLERSYLAPAIYNLIGLK